MSTNPTTEVSATAKESWALMTDLVVNNERRRQVSDALGMSFSQTRAVRRVAHRSMTMGELAGTLGMDPPNVTTLVDALEKQGLVRRKPHPTDRRAKIVEATRKGKALARRADDILWTPPPGVADLSERELQSLRRILLKASAEPPERVPEDPSTREPR